MRIVKKLVSFLSLVALLAGCTGTVIEDCGTSQVTTFAGGMSVFDHLDGTGTEARFRAPTRLTSDGTYLYVVEESVANPTVSTIRKITMSTGEVTTLDLDSEFRIGFFTTDGSNLYATDNDRTKIYKIVINTGEVTEMALTGTENMDLFNFSALVASADGRYLYVGVQRRLLQIEIATGQVSVLAGSGVAGYDDGTRTEASFSYYIFAMATDGTNLYVGESKRIRKVVIATGEVTTLAGGAENPDDGTGTAAGFGEVSGISTDGTNLYVTDSKAQRIRKVVLATGKVTTLAGTGSEGGNNGPGNTASFNKPFGIHADSSSSDGRAVLYVADWFNSVIRKIDYAPGNCPTSTADASKYSVSGSVSGLSAKLVLQNNGGDDTTITESGHFNFARAVTSGGAYDVTVKTQPNGQVCTVTHGKGTANAAVSDINVSCEASATPPSDAAAPTAPTIVDLTTVAQKPTLTGTYDSTDAAGGFKVKVNGTTFTLGTDAELTASGNDWTLTIPYELAIDVYDVVATALDAAGNSSTASGTLTVVAAPPVPTVTAVSTEDTTPALSGTFDSENATTFTVVVNGVTYSLGTDSALSNAGNSWNLTIPDANALAVGTYEVVATATDAANAVKTDATTNELVVRNGNANWSLEDHYTNDTTPTIRGTFPTDVGSFTLLLGQSTGPGRSIWWFFAETRTDPEQGDVLFNVQDGGGIVGSFDRVTGEWELTIDMGLSADYQTTDALSEGTYLLRLVNGPAAVRWDSPMVGFAKLVVDLTAPTAPTVTSQTTSDTTPTISGTFDAADADVFTVAVNNVTYTLGTDAALTSSGDTWSLTIPSALSDGTYDVVATVKDKATNSASDSTTGELVIVPAAPAAPVGVTATAGDGQVTLTWSAVTGATSYNVYYGTGSGVTTLTGTQVANATSGAAIMGLTNGTTYYFIVTAMNAGGESTASSEVSATPVDMQAPTVSASPGSSNFTTSVDVTLSCADTGGSGCAAIHYTLDGSAPTTGSAAYTASMSITSTTTVKFIAVDGASNQSGVQTETYTRLLPAAPTGVSATAGNAQVSVSWSAVTGATSYNVYYGTSSGVTTLTGTKVANATSGAAITGLTNGTTYYFIVTAENISGEGIASSEVNATPQAPDTTAPAVSSGGLTPANGATGVARGSSITATFNEDIFATTVNGTTFTLAGSGAVSGTVSFDGVTNTATFTPGSKMAMLTSHTATLTTGITDLAGNPLASNQTWSFTTADGAWGTVAEFEKADVLDDTSGARVAVDADGNAVAVWLEFNGTTNDVMAKRYVPGVGWGAAQVVDSGAEDAAEVRIAVDANGNAIAVWQQNDSGMTWHVWANRYDAGTNSWGAAQQLDSDTGHAGMPQVAIDGSGNAIVVWDQQDALTITHIWASRYAAGTWGAAVKIEADTTEGATFPAIAMDPAGNAIVVWQQGDGIFTGDIWANRYSAGAWGAAVAIDSNTNPALFAQVAIDDGGNAIAVWVQDDGAVINIYANRYEVGTGWGTATTIADGSGNAQNPQIAMNGSGTALVVWQQNDGAIDNIWAARFAVSSWGTPATIESGALNASNAQIAVDAAGNGMAVWLQTDDLGRASTWASRLTGISWSTPNTIESDDIGDNFMGVDIDMNDNGEAMAVWNQLGNDGLHSVWANSFE